MKRLSRFVLCCWILAGPLAHADSAGILGKWTTANGKSRVEITRCDAGYCGRLVWLKNPVYPADDEQGMAGQTKIDRNNPDPVMRKKPLLGLQVLRGFRNNSGNVWEDGTIYDPENGKTYKCKLTLVDRKQLDVRGFIGFSWIGRTSVWTR